MNLLRSSTGALKFYAGRYNHMIWRIEIQEGFSVSFFDGLKTDDDPIIRKTNIPHKTFILIEYEHAEFVFYDGSPREDLDISRNVFESIKRKENILIMNYVKNSRQEVYESQLFDHARDCLLNKDNIVNKESYEQIKKDWKVDKDNVLKNKKIINILKKCFSGEHAQGDVWDNDGDYPTLSFDKIFDYRHSHVINAAAEDADVNNSIIIFSGGLYDDFSKLSDNILKFHFCIKIDAQECLHKEKTKSLCRKLSDETRKDDDVAKAIFAIVDALV